MAGPTTVTPPPRGISTIGLGRYTGLREPDAPPSHAQLAHSGWKSRVETPRRAHARLPLRGQHRHFTCFPIVPLRNLARGHPVPNAAGRWLADCAPSPHTSDCMRRSLPAQSGLRGAVMPGCGAGQRGFRRLVSPLSAAVQVAGEECTTVFREPSHCAMRSLVAWMPNNIQNWLLAVDLADFLKL